MLVRAQTLQMGEISKIDLSIFCHCGNVVVEYVFIGGTTYVCCMCVGDLIGR